MVVLRAYADCDVLLLGPEDADSLAPLLISRRFTPEVLVEELSLRGQYRWVGIRRPDGRLVGAHRALEWGDYLFLKGVFVEPAAQGGDIALRLAFALREMARQEEKRGIAAWISEASLAQVALARRLRLEKRGLGLHLYVLPVGEPSAVSTARPRRCIEEMAEDIISGYRDHAGERPLVPDLLPRRCRALGFLRDRDRLILGSLPCTDVLQVAALIGELAPLAADLGLSAIELPAPAADIMLGLWLLIRSSARISKSPVYVGIRDFEKAGK